MEHHTDVLVTKVPKGRGVARDPLANGICARSRRAIRTHTNATFSNAKAQTVGPGMIVVMTRSAADILVSRKDLVIKQELSDPGLCRVNWDVIVRRDLGRRGRGKEAKHMRKMAIALVFWAGVAAADMETARDLMEEGKFAEAKELFEVYARSGNADAEELIGVMYALGLGVERDDVRAFDWYLRSSLKGHPGAQSGLGWYYEVGRGIPEPDLVRAYLWYALSAIGGDVDAPDSLEELTPKLTAEERAQAEKMVDDYRVWMYPFR